MDNEPRKDITDRCLYFGVAVVKLTATLPKTEAGRVLTRQFVRSGTSVGANVEEAVGAHSRKDFIAKMVIAYKEARETRYWLKLLDKSQMVKNDYHVYLNDIEQIINILTAIIKTSKGEL